VVCYTNCDVVELFLNGKFIGAKGKEFPRMGYSGRYGQYAKPPVNATTADLHLSWDVPYEPGVLKAVGKRNGEIVYTAEIKTTGAPKAIRISADKSAIASASWDVSHLTVEIIDAEGNMVPDAANRLEFSVEGPGKIIGLDNGNPRDHESFKNNARNTYNGLCLALVQATGKGNIKVTARSEGLGEAFILLSVKP
jgi:beta-galactosidase